MCSMFIVTLYFCFKPPSISAQSRVNIKCVYSIQIRNQYTGIKTQQKHTIDSDIYYTPFNNFRAYSPLEQ